MSSQICVAVTTLKPWAAKLRRRRPDPSEVSKQLSNLSSFMKINNKPFSYFRTKLNFFQNLVDSYTKDKEHKTKTFDPNLLAFHEQ